MGARLGDPPARRTIVGPSARGQPTEMMLGCLDPSALDSFQPRGLPASGGRATMGFLNCSACSGSGQCRRCYGTGKEQGLGGWADEQFGERQDCDHCSGSGECPTCDGKGEVD